MCEKKKLIDVLEEEQMPTWLAAGPPFNFNRNDFFGSRTLYYPGCGLDGHPISLCNRSSRAIHTHVYVDQWEGWKNEVQQVCNGSTEQPYKFKGYEVEHAEDLEEAVLRPGGWIAHENYENSLLDNENNFYMFAKFVVFRREDGYDQRHGPLRMAVLFVGGDGFATYDALFCQKDETPSPYLVVLATGGWSSFGRGSLLERIARRICRVWPKWLLVSTDYTKAWNGYRPKESQYEKDGMNDQIRYLFYLQDEEDRSRGLETLLQIQWSVED